MAIIGSITNWGEIQGKINDYNGVVTGVISNAELVGGQVVGLRGLKGDTGDTGDTGVGIASISKTGTVGLVDTYTITYTNGNTTTFELTNGKDGTDGVDGRDGADGHSPVVTAEKVGKTTTVYVDGVATAIILDGNDGQDGADGRDGQDGQDGHSPVITASKVGDTTTVYLDGTPIAEIKDGQDSADEKVKQSAYNPSGYTYWRPLLVGDAANSTEGFSPTVKTANAYVFNTLEVQPSTGTIRMGKASFFKGSYTHKVSPATLTADRTATLPNKSGTIAFTDDIPPWVTDLGNIDPSEYEDDREVFLNTLLQDGIYRFVWEDGDDFEYYVVVESMLDNGFVYQRYWYSEEGSNIIYQCSLTVEDGEVVERSEDNYITTNDASILFATKNHAHYETKGRPKTVQDFCDEELDFDNGKPYIIYADTLNDKNWLIERYSAVRSPNQRYIRLYDLGDASHFFLRSGIYSAGVITWGNWEEYSSGGGGGSGGDIVYATSNDSASTVSKTATIVSGTLTTLTSGVQAIVKFAETNTASSPTLNIGGTGAKPIKRYGTTAVGQNQNESWVAGSPVLLVYDGTNWVISGWLNTTYSGGTANGITTGTDNLNYIWSPKQIHDGIVALADANVQSDWNEADNTKDDYIKNKPSIPANTSDLVNNSGFITSPNVVYCTCSTAKGTAAKVATIVSGTLTSLNAGDQAIVKFTYHNTAASPTLKIGNTTAKSIMRYGTTTPSASADTSWNAGSPILFVYDGTYWVMVGYLNSVYSEISEANITNGTGSSAGLVTGRRVKKAVETFAPVTSVNGQTGAVTIDSDVYIATYNVTSYSDVLSAIASGKDVVCAYSVTSGAVTTVHYASLTDYTNGASTEEIVFSATDEDTIITLKVTDQDVWSNTTTTVPSKTSDILNDSGFLTKSNFMVKEYTHPFSALSSGNAMNWSEEVSEAGYVPIGVVGFRTSMNALLVNLCRVTYDDVNDKYSINMNARAVASVSAGTASMNVLWIKE